MGCNSLNTYFRFIRPLSAYFIQGYFHPVLILPLYTKTLFPPISYFPKTVAFLIKNMKKKEIWPTLKFAIWQWDRKWWTQTGANTSLYTDRADELRLIKYAHIHHDVFLLKILNINLCVVFNTSCCSSVYNKTKQKPFYIPPRQSSPV